MIGLAWRDWARLQIVLSVPRTPLQGALVFLVGEASRMLLIQMRLLFLLGMGQAKKLILHGIGHSGGGVYVYLTLW
jgi:hypothetical protein